MDDEDTTAASGNDSITKSMHGKNFESDLELEYEFIGDTEAFEAELKECFENSGMVGLRTRLEEKVDEWKNVPIRIGVTGRAGVGKSTFINTIRGVTAESEYAAETGVTETTMAVKEYPHPQNKKLVFCDLPGVGTDNFPKSKYLTDKKIGFDKFDMFIILTSSRIFEDDIWLAQAAKERRTSYLFIRTQIDIDVEKEKKAKPNKFKGNADAEKELEDTIRSDLKKKLNKGCVFEEERVFLIDCTDLTLRTFDFERFMTRVLRDFPAHQREALIMSLKAKTPALIRENVNALRKRAFYKSFSSVFLSSAVDKELVSSEANMYREHLGLTNNQLKEVAKKAGVDIDVIQKTARLRTLEIEWTGAGIVEAFPPFVDLKSLVIGTVSEAIVLIIVGNLIIGSIISDSIRSASKSVASTRNMLYAILDMLESDALALESYLLFSKTKV